MNSRLPRFAKLSTAFLIGFAITPRLMSAISAPVDDLGSTLHPGATLAQRSHARPLETRDWALRETDSGRAWNLSRGNHRIVVAVIDTGIDIEHPALKQNLWINPGENGLDENGRDKRANGIDDDGNGFVDDFHGWNFVSNSNDLTDHHGHGTHIAGLIAARPDPETGHSGIAPNVNLMILKFYDTENSQANSQMNSITTTAAAIRYAVEMKADIINYSGGGKSRSPEEEAAVQLAYKNGVLLVAAAGNERSNSDFTSYYPADYDLPNILSVTAIDARHEILPSSNFGQKTVDVAAPGKNVFSTLPGGAYGLMTGTSQATAIASGIAALLKSQRPDLVDPAQLIETLAKSGESERSLRGKTKFHVRLSSYRALAIADEFQTASGMIADAGVPRWSFTIAGPLEPKF